MFMNATPSLPRLLISIVLVLAAAGNCAAEPLPVVEVRPQAVALTFSADAVVEAVQQSVVAAQMAGRVIEVRADAGQMVRKGEILMRLDAREAAQGAAAAEAVYLNAKANYERTRRLVGQKFLSPAALDKAKADVDAAAASRGGATAAQSHAVIQAPITGVVARRHSELGDMATPGKALFTIYAPGGLRVTANVPQYRLRAMRDVRVARVEFPELGKSLEAASVQLLPTADLGTHVSQVRVALPGLPELLAGVTPGMFARVHFVLGQAQKMVLPEQAVLRRGEVAAVYVQMADGRLALRQLRLGERVGLGEIEVLAGLAVGEKVVTDPVKAAIVLKNGR